MNTYELALLTTIPLVTPKAAVRITETKAPPTYAYEVPGMRRRVHRAVWRLWSYASRKRRIQWKKKILALEYNHAEMCIGAAEMWRKNPPQIKSRKPEEVG